jgi:hypothetical protein
MRKQFTLFLAILLAFPLSSLAQSGQRMLLTFRSQGSMQSLGPYGPAGVTVKAEGFAYLNPSSKGKFIGTGETYVTMDFNYQKTGHIGISQLKGNGPLNVVGETEGKYLRFYFKHQNIPCKGEIVINTPVGPQKEPYEDNFDPHVLAPGVQPGAKIELKDGATQTVNIGPYGGGIQTASWKTDFTLDGIESWRVVVAGEEIDNTALPIKNSKLQNKSKELPVALKYKWQLVGEFSVIGKGGAKQFYDGDVFSAKINREVLFDREDLYRWDDTPCKESWNEEDLNGQALSGKVSGNSVQLKWPKFDAMVCYSLFPLKSYLGQLRPRKEFKSAEFIGYISREKLPLVNGQVVTGGMSDWLKYKITLHKIQ